MRRLLIGALVVGFALLDQSAPAQNPKVEQLKKGLQTLNDYVGTWTGDAKTGAFNPKKETWQENLEWGWKFKSDDVWMVLKFKDSKSYKSGDLRYNTDKKNFQLTLIDLKDQKINYEGGVDKNAVVFERIDPATKDVYRLKLNSIDGVFMNLSSTKQKGGKGLNSEEYKISFKMEGVSLAPGAKKNECVVSGGLGTSSVTYKGQTYYICCSGCRDAFTENPEFYVKQWEAKKGKK